MMPQTVMIGFGGSAIMIGVKDLLNARGWPEVLGMDMSEGQNKLYGKRRERQPASEP